MKHVWNIVLLVSMVMVSSCRKDFDEWNDTAQRHIVFSFNTDSLLTKLLNSDGTYYYPQADTIPSECKLRITAYCYDTNNQLVHSEHILTSRHTNQHIKIRHLQKDNTYRFAFLADVVRYQSDLDFYESWYQLATSTWTSFYIYTDERNTDAIYDVIGYSTCFLTPDNQTEEVFFEPITYNGYCRFTGLNTIDRFSGFFLPCISFYLKDMSYWKLSSLPYEFDYRNPREDIFMPLSMCCADSIIIMQLVTNSLSGVDSTVIKIPNPERRMFMATVDCQKHQLDTCIFY